MPVHEDVYAADLLRYPGPWAFGLPRVGIILVSDEELERLADPDNVLDLSLGRGERRESLRQVCEGAAARGARTLMVAFDHFFSRYRGIDGHQPRAFLPDMDEYIERIAKVGRFAETYGLGLELSLVSPLELGTGYRRATGESGRWLHYREGLRDPSTGAFAVQLWRHERWGNNKGAFELAPAGVRAYAFREERIPGTHLYAVSPDEIAEIEGDIDVDESGPLREDGDFRARRVLIRGSGSAAGADLDRVLVVQSYESPEMDYFSPRTAEFLDDLLTRYDKAGVKLNGLYSDEMHIQQDWHYFSHHEHGQFALRYVTDSFASRFAEAYGDVYADFDKYMVYFCTGQHDFLHTTEATSPAQRVFGPSPRDVHETILFRSRYYRLLEGGVVDLMVDAKRRAEELAGHSLESRAHVTWAESPTIDLWDASPIPSHARKYEFTPDFIWSNTVHQAAAACQDYFRWNAYLTGGGNDHAEGGYADRDYFGLALACSTGVLNDTPYAYAAHWGMLPEIAERRQALVDAFGAVAGPMFQAVQESSHRDVDVLMLYPIDLVAADERFGSWTAQYGYANYITADVLLAEGAVTNGGRIAIRDRTYTTLCALYEPVPSERLLAMMRELVDAGGRVVWSGPPPLVNAEGSDATTAWSELFAAECAEPTALGLPLPGRIVEFADALTGVPAQPILTHLPIDAVNALAPLDGAQVVARCDGRIVGTQRRHPSGGSATALGFRLRDDQSASLGHEARTWFEVLNALGAYPPTDADGVNDNTEFVSRTTPFLACRFPNGTTAVAPHFRTYAEGWEGGFHRNEDRDREWLAEHPLPSDRIELDDFAVNGHRVTYSGRLAVAFRLNDAGELVAFAGRGCRDVEIDGRSWTYADEPLDELAFAPVATEQRVPGGSVARIHARGSGVVRVPVSAIPEFDATSVSFALEGATPGSRGESVAARVDGDAIVVELTGATSGRWIHAVARGA